jgi:hypothetical protein
MCPIKFHLAMILLDFASYSKARMGNPVANRHKWRFGRESVATCQDRRIVTFRVKFSNFFQLNQFVSLFASNGSCNWVVKIYMFWKNLVQTAYFHIFKFSVEQPNFLVFVWCGEFGDRVAHPGSKAMTIKHSKLVVACYMIETSLTWR